MDFVSRYFILFHTIDIIFVPFISYTSSGRDKGQLLGRFSVFFFDTMKTKSATHFQREHHHTSEYQSPRIMLNTMTNHPCHPMIYEGDWVIDEAKPMEVEDFSSRSNDHVFTEDTEMNHPTVDEWYPESENTLHFMQRLNDTHQDTKDTRLFRVNLHGNGPCREASVVLVDPKGVARIAVTVYSGQKSFLVVPIDKTERQEETCSSTTLARPLLSLNQILMGCTSTGSSYHVFIPIQKARSMVEWATRRGFVSFVSDRGTSLSLLHKHRPMLSAGPFDTTILTPKEQGQLEQDFWPTWDQRVSAMIQPLSDQHLVKSFSATMLLKTFFAKAMKQARPVNKRSFYQSFSKNMEAVMKHHKRARVANASTQFPILNYKSKNLSRVSKRARHHEPSKQDIRHVVLQSLLPSLTKADKCLSSFKRRGLHVGRARPMKRARLAAQ